MKALRIALVSLVALPAPILAQENVHDGTPAFSASRPIAYYVWRDGGTWHVRWTSLQRMRKFNGSVIAQDGALTALVRIDPEKELASRAPSSNKLPFTIVREGPVGRPPSPPPPSTKAMSRADIEMDGTNRITFDSQVDGGINGFDFTADESVTELAFVLEIANKSQPGMVFVGRKSEKPESLPLVIVLK